MFQEFVYNDGRHDYYVFAHRVYKRYLLIQVTTFQTDSMNMQHLKLVNRHSATLVVNPSWSLYALLHTRSPLHPSGRNAQRQTMEQLHPSAIHLLYSLLRGRGPHARCLTTSRDKRCCNFSMGHGSKTRLTESIPCILLMLRYVGNTPNVSRKVRFDTCK